MCIIHAGAGRLYAPAPPRRRGLGRAVLRSGSLVHLSSLLLALLVCARAFGQGAGALAAPEADTARLEQALAREASLADILQLAHARNPELLRAGELARAAAALAPAAARLPDPELEYQLWAQPIARPLAFDRAQMHMLGLRQALPAPGSLSAAGAAARAEADGLAAARRASDLDLRLGVRRAYARYAQTDRELSIHREHVQLAGAALELLQARHAGGGADQAEVLRARAEQSRLHAALSVLTSERVAAAALLNRLMRREPSAPLGPPRPLAPAPAALEPAPGAARPELEMAQDAVRAREHELDMYRASARWPSFSVGVQYMYMPGEPEPNDYGVMLSASLPWLSARHGEEVRAAEARLSAQRHALSSERAAAGYELAVADARVDAARAALGIVERELVPQLEQSVESARAALLGGAGAMLYFDALRALLDARIERERALADLEVAQAERERAGGAPHESTTGSAEVE